MSIINVFEYDDTFCAQHPFSFSFDLQNIIYCVDPILVRTPFLETFDFFSSTNKSNYQNDQGQFTFTSHRRDSVNLRITMNHQNAQTTETF